MTRTHCTAPLRSNIAIITLALPLTVLPGLLCPQSAQAQGRRVTGRSARGSVRPNGYNPYNSYTPSMLQNNRGYTPNSPTVPTTPPGRGYNQPKPYAPTYPVGSPRLASPFSGRSIQPFHSPLQPHGILQPLPRALPIHGILYPANAPTFQVTGAWTAYFPTGTVYYPNYYVRYVEGATMPSAYAYYYGAFPMFIGIETLVYQPPQVVYVPVPVYSAGVYQGTRSEGAEPYYLNQKSNNGQNGDTGVAEQDPILSDAISDLTVTWNEGDIRSLARHVRRDAPLAVYLAGKYGYSIHGADYLNMTHDAIAAIKTTRFVLDKVERKEKDTYAVSGSHTYTDKQGMNHTVFVSYVLHKTDDDYYLIQVGTAPEKLAD